MNDKFSHIIIYVSLFTFYGALAFAYGCQLQRAKSLRILAGNVEWYLTESGWLKVGRTFSKSVMNDRLRFKVYLRDSYVHIVEPDRDYKASFTTKYFFDVLTNIENRITRIQTEWQLVESRLDKLHIKLQTVPNGTLTPDIMRGLVKTIIDEESNGAN